MQPVIGWLLDLGWDGQLVEGARVLWRRNLYRCVQRFARLQLVGVDLHFVATRDLLSTAEKVCRHDVG